MDHPHHKNTQIRDSWEIYLQWTFSQRGRIVRCWFCIADFLEVETFSTKQYFRKEDQLSCVELVGVDSLDPSLSDQPVLLLSISQYQLISISQYQYKGTHYNINKLITISIESDIIIATKSFNIVMSRQTSTSPMGPQHPVQWKATSDTF